MEVEFLVSRLRHIGSCDVGAALTTATSFLKQTTNTTRCFIFNPLMMNYSRPIDGDDWVYFISCFTLKCVIRW